MKKIMIMILFTSIAHAGEGPELFKKYDFAKLDPKPITVQFPMIAVTVWDRCTQCDCPEPEFKEEKSLEEIDGITYRNTFGIVKGPRTFTGTKNDDGAILISKKEDDCLIDTIITTVEDHPKAKVPCDKGCADVVKLDDKPKKGNVDVKHGCSSSGASVWLIPFLILFFSRKVFKWNIQRR